MEAVQASEASLNAFQTTVILPELPEDTSIDMNET
jgi:hypothetical protein